MRPAFNYALKQGYLSHNPCEDVDLPKKIPRRIPKRFTGDEIKAIFDKIDRPDDFALALTLLLTGIRRGEAFNIKWSDIDFSARRIRVTGKTGEREVAMSPLLHETLSGMDRDEKPFGSLRRSAGRFERYIRSADIYVPGCFHRFRHTTASALADMGYTELDIQVYLGHSIRGVTRGYISIGLKRFQDMAAALDEWLKQNILSKTCPN